jgi:hypothetical protein
MLHLFKGLEMFFMLLLVCILQKITKFLPFCRYHERHFAYLISQSRLTNWNACCENLLASTNQVLCDKSDTGWHNGGAQEFAKKDIFGDTFLQTVRQAHNLVDPCVRHHDLHVRSAMRTPLFRALYIHAYRNRIWVYVTQ